MAKRPSAGDLYYRVAFDKLGAAADGYGGTTSAFTEQFQCRAAYTHLRGGEAVLAGRLEGRHTLVITVRASTQTRQVTTDWRIRDARDGTVYAIRDIEALTTRDFIAFTCESGVAA